ncbi:MAG: ABC transporter permease [Methylobacter sp.]|nr:ABC transporter permease [Methylobacter sp.]MDP2099524.1 ABC transporter permease [Methylobacter sp.]MDP2428664.1 ABC transporter permease [Methylobacter sp.]MDP3055139.1 ABC transporter permease [Methylobacter sp.]MDP3364210.1 ABC transporter permease [Methylobacter sp.]
MPVDFSDILTSTTLRFFNPFLSLLGHYPLILQLVKREVIGRYRGSFLGLLWSFVNPVLMLAVYTFVFGFVFKARWGQGDVDQYEFALVLFAGLMVFNLFSECILRAPNLILSNVNYVKKVIFPLEILPWVALGSALFHTCISLGVLLVFLAILGHSFSWTMLLLPIVLLPFLLLIMGLSWLLASLGVFIRDIGQLVGMAITVLMFMSPIFYPLSALPESVSGYLFLNPITFVVEQVRNILLWGKQPDWTYLGIYSAVSLVTAWLGLFWFEKTRKGFADVL